MLTFFKNTGKTCGEISTYKKGTPKKKKKKKRDSVKDKKKRDLVKDFSNESYGILCVFVCVCVSDFFYESICCGYSFELHRQVDAIQMGTLNICLYKKVDKKYTGCNLKTTELLDYALIGICAVIRSNTVCQTRCNQSS